MLIGVAIGQRTPGFSLRDGAAFEARIGARYTEYIAEAGWQYLGAFDVAGVVPGAVGEVMVVDAVDGAEAMRLDAEHEAGGLPADIVAMYSECRALFWQRGSLRFWARAETADVVPRVGEAVRITSVPAGTPGALAVEPWTAGGVSPLEAVVVEPLEMRSADVDDTPLGDDLPPLPSTLPPGASLVMVPLPTGPFG